MRFFDFVGIFSQILQSRNRRQNAGYPKTGNSVEMAKNVSRETLGGSAVLLAFPSERKILKLICRDTACRVRRFHNRKRGLASPERGGGRQSRSEGSFRETFQYKRETPQSVLRTASSPFRGGSFPQTLCDMKSSVDTARRVPTKCTEHLASCAQLEQPDGVTLWKIVLFRHENPCCEI